MCKYRYTCTYTDAYRCIYVYIDIHIHIFLHIHLHIYYTYIYTHLHTYIQTDRQTDIYTCIHRNTRTHIHMDAHMDIHVRMRMPIHMSIHMPRHTHTHRTIFLSPLAFLLKTHGAFKTRFHAPLRDGEHIHRGAGACGLLSGDQWPDQHLRIREAASNPTFERPFKGGSRRTLGAWHGTSEPKRSLDPSIGGARALG